MEASNLPPGPIRQKQASQDLRDARFGKPEQADVARIINPEEPGSNALVSSCTGPDSLPSSEARKRDPVQAKEMMISEWKGKWALVTGASAGIGKALAEQLALGGTNLVLTARRRDRLESLAQELGAKYKIRTEIFVADLTLSTAPREIFDFTEGKRLAIDLLVNNAGFGQYGELHQVDLERLLDMVRVNCSAVLHLTRLYLPAMVAKRGGDVLIVASTASFQAVPYISTYAATKAFDLFLAEGLAEEMKPHGVRVCALCPGTTTSEFHEVAGHPSSSKGREQSAETVARNGLKALAAGKSYVISGLGNYLGAQGERLVPRRFVTRIAAKLFRPAAKSTETKH